LGEWLYSVDISGRLIPMEIDVDRALIEARNISPRRGSLFKRRTQSHPRPIGKLPL